MRKQILRMLCVAGILFGLAETASARGFQLLAPNVGWTIGYEQRILWTTDDGRHWKDITPPSKDGSGGAPFFLDRQRGWVLLAYGEPGVRKDFDLAVTDNTGAAWSVIHPILPPADHFVRGGQVAFADSLHGWMALQAGMSVGVNGQGCYSRLRMAVKPGNPSTPKRSGQC